MMTRTVVILLAFGLASVLGSREEAPIRPTWEEYLEKLDALYTDPETREQVLREDKAYYELAKSTWPWLNSTNKDNFPCDVAYYRSPRMSKPTSVHQLTPQDIEVVAAIGDSITAGNGIDATNAAGVRTQYRGYSWSIGGESPWQDHSHTVPNVLKYYNPDVTGFSLGEGTADDYAAARMNVAVPGSIARDLPDQAKKLTELMKERDYDKQKWKLVTLFIGGNDLCRYCNNPEVLSPQNYAMHIQDTLDYLHKNMEHVFVNVVGMFDLTTLGKIDIGFTCKLLHPLLCPCGIDPVQEAEIRKAKEEYNTHIKAVIDSGRYDGRDDFTVVYQPMLENMDVPYKPDGKADLSFFAPDCFHFSRKGHNSVAVFLWNAMFQAVGSKSHHMDYGIDIYCPKPGEFLRTVKNSGGYHGNSESGDGWVPRVEDDAEEEPDHVTPSQGGVFDFVPSSWQVPLFWALSTASVLLMATMVTVLVLILKRKPVDANKLGKDGEPLL